MNDQPGRRPQGAPGPPGCLGPRARVALERAEVITTRRTGAHQHLTLVAPQVAAVAVQVGTAAFRDPSSPLRVGDELADLLGARGVDAFTDVIGAAHRR